MNGEKENCDEESDMTRGKKSREDQKTTGKQEKKKKKFKKINKFQILKKGKKIFFFQNGTITTGNRNTFKDGKMKKHNGIEQMYFIDPKLGNDAVAALKTDKKINDTVITALKLKLK